MGTGLDNSSQLIRLSEDTQCDRSTEILAKLKANLRSTVSWLESLYPALLKPWSVSELLRKIPKDDALFLLRIADVRANIDRLVRRHYIGSLEIKQPLENLIARLRRPFEAYAAASSNSPNTSRESYLASVGFDHRRSLTEPFPFVTMLWSGAAPHPDTESDWNEAASVELLFEEEMAYDVAEQRAVLRTGDTLLQARFERAILLLQRVRPSLAHEVACHVRHICWIDVEDWPNMAETDYRDIGQSVSSHLVPGCCFFSLHSLKDDARLFEALYHEALHKKLSALILTDELLRDGYSAQTAPKFHSYWNRDSKWNPNNWEFDRVLFALHVYVHLYWMYTDAAEILQASGIPHSWCKRRAKEASERGLALANWTAAHTGECMTDHGAVWVQRLVQGFPR